jgi:uncharacterized protein YkwD
MENSTLLRKGCTWVLAVVLAVFWAVSSEFVQARETYGQMAERLLSTPPDGAEVRPDLETAILRATNAYRASKGLGALKPANAVLLKAARAHAMDLLATGGMGHVSSGGHNFESRIRALNQGKMFLSPMAENAARVRKGGLSDAQRAQALVQMWIKSSGHRRNLTNRTYVAVSVGVVVAGDDVYAVQVFTGPTVRTNISLPQ